MLRPARADAPLWPLVCVYDWVSVNICVHMHMLVYVCVYACVCICIYVCMYVCMYVLYVLYVCVYVYMCVCVCVGSVCMDGAGAAAPAGVLSQHATQS